MDIPPLPIPPALFAGDSFLLTFDDGPGPSTPALLDVLREASCRALFFVLGSHLAHGGDAMAAAVRIVREGHMLGNHTYAHAHPGALDAAELVGSITQTDALIRRACEAAGHPCGEEIPLRLPYGLEPDDDRLSVLARLGRTHVGWTAIFDDWRRPPPPARVLFESMRRHILAQASQGERAVLCLHDGSRHGEARPATVEAVRLLLGGSPRGDAGDMAET